MNRTAAKTVATTRAPQMAAITRLHPAQIYQRILTLKRAEFTEELKLKSELLDVKKVEKVEMEGYLAGMKEEDIKQFKSDRYLWPQKRYYLVQVFKKDRNSIQIASLHKDTSSHHKDK